MINKAKLNSLNRINELSKPKIRISNNQKDNKQLESIKINVLVKDNKEIEKRKLKKNSKLAEEFDRIIADDVNKYDNILRSIEEMNSIIAEYLVKTKLNERSVEIKIQNEEIRKEKEALLIKNNLEKKVDAVLEKAHEYLNIVGKVVKSSNKNIQNVKE